MDKLWQSGNVWGTKEAVQSHSKSNNGRTYPRDESGVMSQQTLVTEEQYPRGREQGGEGLEVVSIFFPL